MSLKETSGSGSRVSEEALLTAMHICDCSCQRQVTDSASDLNLSHSLLVLISASEENLFILSFPILPCTKTQYFSTHLRYNLMLFMLRGIKVKGQLAISISLKHTHTHTQLIIH